MQYDIMTAKTVANLLPEINLRTRQSSPYLHGNILFAAPATTDPIYVQTCGTLRGRWSSFLFISSDCRG
jgi:hypothetical protein